MKSLISKLIRAIFLTTLVTGSWAAAANDTPPPPDEVFRYAIFDAGDALEIDWAVSDGAYMYRDAFDFESGNPAVVLGAAEMPEGKVHSDEFLGEQTVYRGSFFIRIPYTVAGNKPDSLMLTIKSRGCLDSGFCYVPQTWVETVTLEKPKAAGRKLDLGALGGSSQSEFPPPDASSETTRAQVRSNSRPARCTPTSSSASRKSITTKQSRAFRLPAQVRNRLNSPSRLTTRVAPMTAFATCRKQSN